MRYRVPIRKRSMDCHGRRDMNVLRHVWAGNHTSCSSVLHSPLNGSFDGIFADADAPVSVFVLSDSIGQQVLAALHGAQRVNPHLHALTFASASSSADRMLHPLNMGLLPRTSTAAHALLDSILWPPATTRRVVVAGSASWYNLVPLCNLPLTSFQNRCNFSTHGRPILDLDDPFARPRWSHEGAPSMGSDSAAAAPIWGWANHARRTGLADGSAATINEYEEDLGAFLQAATARRTNTTLVWFEYPPEHRSSELGNMACSAEPSVLMPSTLEHFAHGAYVLCPNALSVQDFLDEPRCKRRVSRWQNHVAARLTSDAHVPMAWLWDSLSSRPDLHDADCLHWCEPSEAGVQMAMAVLNTIAAHLRKA
jgi:hypothetical protein